jgi:hypothetical protein
LMMWKSISFGWKNGRRYHLCFFPIAQIPFVIKMEV